MIFRVQDKRARGEFNDEIGAIMAGFLGALPMAAVCGFKLAFVLKLLKGALAMRCHEDDVTAFAPVTTVRSAAGDKFFASEAYASTAPVPGLDGNSCFINKFHAS
jgi:hypothetical protein